MDFFFLIAFEVRYFITFTHGSKKQSVLHTFSLNCLSSRSLSVKVSLIGVTFSSTAVPSNDDDRRNRSCDWKAAAPNDAIGLCSG